ncbi:hypothetical protein [Acinetobacter baumannii]|uniref:hypothetical protein n=1 Tax=Acinetobacter baumannii TaxID=470 RepID=UPI0022B529C2|nr:hypothetical protein [Acinetobacter baumannii]
MDKCREEFEKQRYWIGLFRDAVDFDEELGRYVLNGQRKLYAFHLDSFNEKWAIWQEAWQHQQAKVEELQKRVDALELKLREIAGIARRARHGEYYTESGRNAGLNIAAEIEQALKGEGNESN